MADFYVDTNKRTFTIVVAGFQKESTNFVETLKQKAASINPSNYYLILDGEEMKTFKPEVLLVLEQAYALYMSLGFKKILMLTPKRVTPRLQLRRIAKKCHFTGVFVNGKEGASKYMKEDFHY